MPPEDACLDFRGFQDRTIFFAAITLEQVMFTRLGSRNLIVMGADIESRSLRFDEHGVGIAFAEPTSGVLVEARSDISDPIEFTAFDAAGDILAWAEIPGDRTAHSVSLTGGSIVRVVAIGGGGEGAILSVGRLLAGYRLRGICQSSLGSRPAVRHVASLQPVVDPAWLYWRTAARGYHD